jgi:outer membrane protein OmpA-like peptidoglycan-associated protein
MSTELEPQPSANLVGSKKDAAMAAEGGFVSATPLIPKISLDNPATTFLPSDTTDSYLNSPTDATIDVNAYQPNNYSAEEDPAFRDAGNLPARAVNYPDTVNAEYPPEADYSTTTDYQHSNYSAADYQDFDDNRTDHTDHTDHADHTDHNDDHTDYADHNDHTDVGQATDYYNAGYANTHASAEYATDDVEANAEQADTQPVNMHYAEQAYARIKADFGISTVNATATQADAAAVEANTVDATATALQELRQLLLGQEQESIAQIQQRLGQPFVTPELVSAVLPDAIIRRNNVDSNITKALQPSVEEAIRVSVKKQPRILVDALFPVIGPAIRKAIGQAMTGMLESLNQSLEQSFSLQGLQWRLEALRTGRSFAEIVLLKTLVYRVEQVFLIHRETGLLLQHLQAPAIVAQDADMVSGMFSAIQDFVKDSFGVKEHEALESLQVGELTVWIEQGPRAILAAVVRGNPTMELRSVLQETLEIIHLEQNTALAEFSGDATAFEVVRNHLENCLQAQYGQKKAEDAARKLSPLLVVSVLLVVILLPLTILYVRDSWRWQAYLNQLNNQPGIVITATTDNWRRYQVKGLRDPLASDPESFLLAAKLNPQWVKARWEPYQTLHPDFVRRRAVSVLQPPPTVALEFQSGVLTASGQASVKWLLEARKLARVLAGVNSFNAATIEQDLVANLRRRIEGISITFLLGSKELNDAGRQLLLQMVPDIQALNELADVTGQKLILEVTGNADSLGSAEFNKVLRAARAQTIAQVLREKAIADNILQVADNNENGQRNVQFRIILQPRVAAP